MLGIEIANPSQAQQVGHGREQSEVHSPQSGTAGAD
jgi:hypothetical protein